MKFHLNIGLAIIVVLLFSCKDQKAVEAVENDSVIPSEIPFIDFLHETDIKEMHATSTDWKEYVENYHNTVHANAGSGHLSSYRHTALISMVVLSDLLEAAPLDTLIFIAHEFNDIKHAYPEASFGLLQSYLDRGGKDFSNVRQIAIGAQKKARQDKEWKEELYHSLKSEDKHIFGFVSDYEMFLPKLDSLSEAMASI